MMAATGRTRCLCGSLPTSSNLIDPVDRNREPPGRSPSFQGPGSEPHQAAASLAPGNCGAHSFGLPSLFGASLADGFGVTRDLPSSRVSISLASDLCRGVLLFWS